MKVVEDDGLAVAERQREHGSANFVLARLLLERVELLRGAGGFWSLFDREIDGWEAPELRAENVGGERKEPGGEAGFPTPLGKAAPCAQKGFLGHLFCAAAVTAIAPRHINERPLPAADDAFEGGDISGEHASDVGQILIGPWVGGSLRRAGKIGQVRCSPMCATGVRRMRLHFVCGEISRRKCNQAQQPPVPPVARGDRPRQQDQEDCMTNLATMFGDVPAFGMWMFLSIGAVALFVVFIPLTSWIDSQRKEREAFYKAETMRRLAESSGEGAKAAIELLREQARQGQIKKREGMKIGGLINLAVGIGIMIFLGQLVKDAPVYLCGLIPALIGEALLTYALLLAPKEG